MADKEYLDYEGLAEFKNFLNGVDIVTTAGDGATYTATVPGITALKAGLTLTIIPHTVSTAVLPKLNVNSLGAKAIRRRVSNSTATTVASATTNWLAANKPIRVTYDGTYWIADMDRPNAIDLYGTVPVANGGTGVTTILALIEQMFMNIDDSPTYITTFKSGQANGGYTTPQKLRNAMGLGDTLDALPIANGGTGATDAATAIKNLGAIPGITEYYSGTKSADDLDVPLALIPCSTTSNAELYKALGSSGFAYVLTLFYGSMATTANRVQVAFSYNTTQLSMAMRKYSGSWTKWVSVAGTRLAMGTEYLTAELYNNKPVYTMLFNGGAISDGAEIDYPGIDADTISVIDSRCTIDRVPIPQRATGTWGTADAKSVNFACYLVNQNSIIVSCGTGMAGNTIYVQIWYTKD